MGEITDFVTLYLKDSDLLEEKLDKMSMLLVENIQNQLYKGHGRVNGNLKDSIQSDYTVNGLEGLVRARITEGAPYGAYVNDGYAEHDIVAKPGSALNTPYGLFKRVHHPGFDGLHFMESGLEETVALYR